jgi:glycosyltransferase involved in cell wall biosynthesis
MKLRFGFHYHVPALAGDHGMITPGVQARFLDALAAECEEVVCYLHTPRPDETQLLDSCTQSPNLRLVSIGAHNSVPRRILSATRHSAPVKGFHGQLDLLLLRGPSPLLPAMARAAFPTPTVLLLVGNATQGVDDLPQPRWRKGLIRLFWKWNHRRQLKVAANSLTFVNSRKLFEELKDVVPHLRETRTTTLGSSDYFVREDTCQKRPFRLLYAGRMERGKGLLEIAQAMAELVSQGEDVVLDLVGPRERGDAVVEEIQKLARSRAVAGHIQYHGNKAVGAELFSFYRQADLYVIASKSSEGFPRTIWEAMAHSVPVVATRVGSIPHFVDGAAELVPPNDIGSLTGAIRGLIHSPERRMELIRKGRALALEMTLDKQVGRMVKEIECFLARNQAVRLTPLPRKTA